MSGFSRAVVYVRYGRVCTAAIGSLLLLKVNWGYVFRSRRMCVRSECGAT
jgi:hypothetical protein